MESIELQVEQRETAGKGAARKLRRVGKVPAVLYGPKRETVHVTVDAKEFGTRVGSSRRSVLVRMQSNDPTVTDRLALVKDVQLHPVSGDFLHADLYEVDVTAKLRVRVPLEFTGKAAGVELGGILQPILREVAVLCLPTEIPEVLRVDVSTLGIHDALHMSQIQAPQGVEVQFDSDEPVVTVLAPTVEEVKVEAPTEGEESPAATATGESKAEGKE